MFLDLPTRELGHVDMGWIFAAGEIVLLNAQQFLMTFGLRADIGRLELLALHLLHLLQRGLLALRDVLASLGFGFSLAGGGLP